MNANVTQHYKVFQRLALATIAVLLVPLIVMQFSSEVNWGSLDFIVMGVLLFISGSAVILSYRFLNRKHFRIIAVCIVLGFMWLWAELAVGVFTTWGS